MSAVWGAQGAATISPSDSTDLATAIRGISFAVVGALKVTMIDSTVVTIPSGALAAGIIHPLVIKRVWQNGTTATGLVGYS